MSAVECLTLTALMSIVPAFLSAAFSVTADCCLSFLSHVFHCNSCRINVDFSATLQKRKNLHRELGGLIVRVSLDANMKPLIQSRSWPIAMIIAFAIFANHASSQEESTQAGNVRVEQSQDTEILKIRILSDNGEVAWGDVLRALLRTGQFDDSVLKDKIPSGKIDLNLRSSRILLFGINSLLSPDIEMRIHPAETDQGEAFLLVKVDQGALREKRRKVQRQIRDKLKDNARERFGLQFPTGWQQSEDHRLLVIVVHGFNSSPARFRKLVTALQNAQLTSGTYSYPDDQPIADSAQQFSNVLKELATQHPERPVALVTHSMGGLVSRAVVEDPKLDPGNVTKLIMVAPPNHGSLLAHFSFGIDLFDHASTEEKQSDSSRWSAAIADGLNEAAVDLTPGSQFLRKLNARPRNPNIDYSILLGTDGRISKANLENLRRVVNAAQSQGEVPRLLSLRLDKILSDLEEVVAGQGDDAVAVKRGRLAGVKDTVLLKFTHLDALQQEDQLEGHELYESVLKRLRR